MAFFHLYGRSSTLVINKNKTRRRLGKLMAMVFRSHLCCIPIKLFPHLGIVRFFPASLVVKLLLLLLNFLESQRENVSAFGKIGFISS